MCERRKMSDQAAKGQRMKSIPGQAARELDAVAAGGLRLRDGAPEGGNSSECHVGVSE